MTNFHMGDGGSEDDASATRELLVGARSATWLVTGASVGGTVARARRKPMQDACAAIATDAGELLLAVADGAGSARLGGEGARAAVCYGLWTLRCATLGGSALADALDPEVNADAWATTAHRMLRAVRWGVIAEARRLRGRRDEVACTLTLVYASSMGVLLAQIGDGRCAVQRHDGRWEALNAPQHGSYAGETCFVTSPDWRRNAHSMLAGRRVGDIRALAVMTDGCERTAYECLGYDETSSRYVPRNVPYAPFLSPNVAAVRASLEGGAAEPLQVAARWAAFLRDGTPELPALRDEPDDKTMVLAVRVSQAPEG